MPTSIPLPGQRLKASMLAQPYRGWGYIDDGVGPGTAFAVLTVTQVTTPALQVYSERAYEFTYFQNWRCDAANNTMSLELEENLSGAWALVQTFRGTNAVDHLTGSTDTAAFTAVWVPGVTTAAAQLRIQGSRFAGAGTITPGTFRWTLKDIGQA